MSDPQLTARARRADIRRQTDAMGIDEDYICVLVDTFYERVRAHALLGPIFETAIGDDWEPHLARMKQFWASVALNAGVYHGKPVPAHVKLEGVEPWHFDIWLGLFRQTLEDTAPSEEAKAHFMDRADRIAQSLKFAMFGLGLVKDGHA